MNKIFALVLAVFITGGIFYIAYSEKECELPYTQEDIEQSLEYYKIQCYRLRLDDVFCENLLADRLYYMEDQNKRACPVDE